MPAAENMENNVLTHQFRSGSWIKPTALWIGLLTATPEDSGGMVEVTASEYARQQRNPSDTNWSQSADFSVYNADAISFAEPLTDWGTVTAVALFDSETDGNLIAYQLLDEAKTVSAGGALLQFQPGALRWKMNDITA